MSSSSPARYGVLVPVKPPAVAKSRLAGLGDTVREALVVSFAADTVSAALESPLVARVLVVTDDHELARMMSALGASVVPDGTADDLNGSLVQAAAELHRRWPGLGIVALTADLPAVRPEELTRALEAANGDGQSFVADADGTGTTMLVSPNMERFQPQFGAGSRQAHLMAGAEEIRAGALRGLRRDVDDPDDLSDALSIGVGDRTASVADGLGLAKSGTAGDTTASVPDVP